MFEKHIKITKEGYFMSVRCAGMQVDHLLSWVELTRLNHLTAFEVQNLHWERMKQELIDAVGRQRNKEH